MRNVIINFHKQINAVIENYYRHQYSVAVWIGIIEEHLFVFLRFG